MTKLTKERLIVLSNRENVGAICGDEIVAMARQLLASMEQEPVYQVYGNNDDTWSDVDEEEMIRCRSIGEDTRTLYSAPQSPVVDSEPVAWTSEEAIAEVYCDETAMMGPKHMVGDVALYRHAQQPVVPDDIKLRELFDSWFASDCSFDRSPEASEEDNIAWRESYWYVWQRCRAAMLQAGNSPVIPEGYVMVPKVPSQAHLNSIAMRYRHDFYLLNDAQKDSALAVARQMYEECSGQGFYTYTLPVAPHDTPALNSLQSVDSVVGRWIPVSERMPEDRTQVILWDAEIGEVTSGHYSHKTHTFYHCGDSIENEITHWMPLPAAPQQEVKSGR